MKYIAVAQLQTRLKICEMIGIVMNEKKKSWLRPVSF